MMNRQIVARQLGLDQEKEVKRQGPLREAWGLKPLAHFAEYMDETVPDSTPLMDWMFGEKPVQENHDEEWWRKQRPRPLRGETADPSIPAAERAEFEAKRLQKLMEEADAKEAEEMRQKDAAEEKAAKESADSEKLATEDAKKRRLAFFGRPAQKFTLKKRAAQLDRNKWEHQAAMFAHLQLDAQTEHNFQEKAHKNARKLKDKAAGAAANFRAEEKGARVAAKSLGLGGKQLADAKKSAEEAAMKYAEQAVEQEEEARRQKIAEEEALKAMKREAEKVRVCQGQIKFLKGEAKTAFEEAAACEINEIKALVAEKLLLADFKSVWEARKKKLPRSSPLYLQAQNKIDMYDVREDVVSMEMNMFVFMYTKEDITEDERVSAFELDKNFPPSFAHKITEKGPQFVNLPEPQAITWIIEKQTPGMICLGQVGKAPLMANRKKVVQTNKTIPQKPNWTNLKKEWDKEWTALDLPEEVCDEIGHKKTPIKLDPSKLQTEKETFVSKEAYELRGEDAKNDSKLTPEELKRLWPKEQHKTVVKQDGITVVLRHTPDCKYLCTWVPQKATIYEEILPPKEKNGHPDFKPVGKPEEGKDLKQVDFKQVILNGKPFKSLNLGPMKKNYVVIECPPLHPQDMVEPDGTLDVNGSDKQPRVEGRVIEWLFERGQWVPEGETIVTIEVKDIRKSTARMAFTPTGWEQEVFKDKGKDLPPEYLEGFEKCLHHYEEGVNRVQVKAPVSGKLTGLMRDSQSRVVSFDVLASIDVGEFGWENVLLPVAEWPDPSGD